MVHSNVEHVRGSPRWEARNPAKQDLQHRRRNPDSAKRAAYLDDACGNDASLRKEIEDLFSPRSGRGELPGIPSAGVAATLDQPITERPGTVIGRYKLLEQIGEGGFGVVFMAEQQEPVRRKVALKIIKPGMDTKEVIARFEAERQALAMMDHPNIAKVLDAGATESGRPYFVMELVRGMPITDYCDQNNLTTRERLELFIAVCQAVQHAHQKGIIHRDIKPIERAGHAARRQAGAQGDRLRRGQGDRPAAHRADALHAVRPDDRHAAVHEPRAGRDERAGRGHADRHLLAGRAAVRTAHRHHAVRHADASARRPTTRCGGSSARKSRPSPARGSARWATRCRRSRPTARRSPKKLSALVRGDLDWIVMKALEKDRTRRYETANDFAQDIERYLTDEPVQACPPSAAYRFKKFAR